MNKDYKFSLFFLLTILTLIIISPYTKAVDVCASKTLYTSEIAAEDCPKVCAKASCCKKDGWSGMWSTTQATLSCRWPNGYDSVCGCTNTSCCYSCDMAALACARGCNSNSCLWACPVAWKLCQKRCGGCPKSEEKHKETPNHENLPVEKKSSDHEEPPKEKESPVVEEPPKPKELPSHKEDGPKS